MLDHTAESARQFARIPRGQHGLSPELVSADQRARLHAAMVQTVAESGFAAMTVEDVLSRAGVSRRTFYEHYDNKQDCFLGACDEVLEHWLRQGSLAYRNAIANGGQDAPTARLRAVLGTLFSQVQSDPLGARTIFVESLNCGIPGLQHLELAVAQLERVVYETFTGQDGAPGIPRAIATVIVGGVLEIITVRLRHGRTGELAALEEPLLKWMLSYRSPAAAAVVERAHTAAADALSPAQATSVQSAASGQPEETLSLPLWRDESVRPIAVPDARTRIIDAAAQIASDRGYGALSINEIDRAAAVSHHTFRKYFSSKDEAFIAAYAAGAKEVVEYCLKAFAAVPNWRAAVHAGLAAELRFLAARPALARIGFLEVYAAGPEALELRATELHMFTAALAPGYQKTGRRTPPHVIVSEAIAGGIYQLMRESVLHDGPERLPCLSPQATYAALAPFVGARAAAATAAGRVTA
jgi:AcrR family transcriptional regulator